MFDHYELCACLSLPARESESTTLCTRPFAARAPSCTSVSVSVSVAFAASSVSVCLSVLWHVCLFVCPSSPLPPVCVCMCQSARSVSQMPALHLSCLSGCVGVCDCLCTTTHNHTHNNTQPHTRSSLNTRHRRHRTWHSVRRSSQA